MVHVPTEKLHKVMARAGVGSRRACEEIIRQGRVMVDGHRAAVEERVASHQRIEVDGHTLLETKPQPFVVMLHKPPGYVTTARDPQGRPTVVQLVDIQMRLYPVGRLDLDSTGLLLLTNDGALAHRLTHPRFKLPRVYWARVDGHPKREALTRLARGVPLEDGPSAPCEVKQLRREQDTTVLEIIMYEGRKRQVRRMCDAVEHPVRELHRTRLGPLALGTLAPGKWRKLKQFEIKQLRDAVGLP